MLLTLVLIGLMSTLIMSASGALRQSQKSTDAVRQDFSHWYTGLQTRALYRSQPHRVCLHPHRATLETYTRATGWQAGDVFFLPRPGVRITTPDGTCSDVLNAGDGHFLSQVRFDEDR